eukprot:TRINITY_DN30941_c0_g1_i1.p1 TRINITY_DN30941_c0_g1~~TRINITY_DN30941_c0_g1_i1.p1  ORF type:complete len:541 (-),score=56.78 TRINITY_DN30941_c0_g1_i1:119-1690(-)
MAAPSETAAASKLGGDGGGGLAEGCVCCARDLSKNACYQACGIHYGYIALVLSALVLLASSPGHSFGVASFVDYWISDIGVPRTTVSAFWATATFVCAPLLPFCGALIDKLGVSRTFRCSYPVFGVVLMGMSQITRPWQLCLSIICNRLITADLLPMIANVHLNKWFVAHRGKASVIFNLVGTVMALFPSLASWLIKAYGWRQAYARISMLLYVTLFPAFCFMRESPESCGVLPDCRWEQENRVSNELESGGAPKHGADAGNADGESESWEIRDVLRSCGFWILIAGAMVTTEHAAMAFHMVDITHAMGLPGNSADQIFFILSVSSLASGALAGILVDRLARPHLVLAASNFVVTIAFIIVLLAPTHYVVWALLLGLNQGFQGSTCSVVFVKYYGQKHIGKITGIVQCFMLLVSGVGPLGFGMMADLFGGLEGYRRCFFALIGLNCVSCAVITCLPRPQHPLGDGAPMTMSSSSAKASDGRDAKLAVAGGRTVGRSYAPLDDVPLDEVELGERVDCRPQDGSL